jgi:hypothetical protein
MKKNGAFQIGDKVTGTKGSGAEDWHGEVKKVEKHPELTHLPFCEYYQVYFHERANNPEERAPQRITPIVGMRADQLQLIADKEWEIPA